MVQKINKMPVQYSDQPFDSEEFRIGVIRDSMTKNEVLLQQHPRLGKNTSRAYALPKSKTFVHGVKNYYVDGGVAEIMKQPLQLSGPTIKQEKTRTRDWAALNRAAVQTGATSAKDLTQFRMQHNIWAKEPEHYRHAKDLQLPFDFTHGVANRPGTPIDTLIRQKYQRKWLQEKKNEQNKATQRALNNQELTVERAFENKASRLRKSKIGQGLRMSRDVPWQMPKWDAVPAHISSFRSKTMYDASFQRHGVDKSARIGAIGQGIYS